MDRARTVPIAPGSAVAALRSLSSGERLLGLYNHAVTGCAERNREQVTAALEELISLLDFGYGEVAEGFYRLYSFCLREIRLGQFEQPAWILRDLRDTWADTFSDATANTTPPVIERAAQVG
jgi:flagellin-specific chaperone FliS